MLPADAKGNYSEIVDVGGNAGQMTTTSHGLSLISDWVEIDGPTHEALLSDARERYRRTRSYSLSLCLLEGLSSPLETAVQRELETLLLTHAEGKILLNILVRLPLCNPSRAAAVAQSARESHLRVVSSVFDNLHRAQVPLQRLLSAWEQLPLQVFADASTSQTDLWQELIDQRILHDLVTAPSSREFAESWNVAIGKRRPGKGQAALVSLRDLLTERLFPVEERSDLSDYTFALRKQLKREQADYYSTRGRRSNGTGYVSLAFLIPVAADYEPSEGLLLFAGIDRNVGGRTVVRNIGHFVRQSKGTLVLKGEPGAGKSTAMREIALRVLAQRSDIFPIFVRLQGYRAGTDLADHISADLAGLRNELSRPGSANFWNALQGPIAQGRALFLFDGIDEIRSQEQEEAYTRLKEFAGRVGLFGNRTIYSCREMDYDPRLAAPEVWIAPLDRKRIKAFLAMHLSTDRKRKAGELTTRLLNPALGLTTLCQNPLYLEMVTTHLNLAPDPDRSVTDLSRAGSHLRLFKDLLRARFQRAVESGSLRPQLEELFASVLGKLALAGIRGMRLNLAAIAELTNARTDEDAHLAREIVRGAMLEKILVPDPQDSACVQFRHRRIQEYLVAHELARQRQRPDLALRVPIESAQLEQILLLYSAMAPDARNLIESIIDRAGPGSKWGDSILDRQKTHRLWVLAARCTGVAPGDLEDLRTAVSEQLRLVLARGEAPERVEALDALRFVLPQGKFTSLLISTTDQSSWVHEAILRKLQTTPVSFVVLARSIFRHLRSIKPTTDLLRIVWENLHFVGTARSGLVAGIGAVALLWQLLPISLLTVTLAVVPGTIVLARALWGDLAPLSGNDIAVAFAVGIVLSALVWLSLRAGTRWRWGVNLSLGTLTSSIVTGIAAERLPSFVAWQAKRSALPPPRVEAHLPEVAVLGAILVVAVVACFLQLLLRRSSHRKRSDSVPQLVPEKRSSRIPQPAWITRTPPTLALAVCILAFLLAPPTIGTVIGAMIMTGVLMFFWGLILRRSRREAQEFRNVVREIMRSESPAALEKAFEYLQGDVHPLHKRHLAMLLERKIDRPDGTVLEKIAEFQNKNWAQPETKDALWQTYKVLERRLLRRMNSEQAA